MIKTFRHNGLQKLFETGSRAGVQAAHADRLRRQLSALNAASKAEHMNIPGWDFHPLQGKLKGRWSISVNGNWRMVFIFEGGDATLVDYLDYH